MKRIGLCCFFCFLTVHFSNAQREAANWYFGQNAGLNFNSGAPEFLPNGQINTIEGCESFSDGNGNLLFYTDGKTVWNRQHEIMPNGEGLQGSASTAQSALVVPNPDNNNIYYVFTPDDALLENFGDETNGFNYSIVDMSQQNGRGDVTQKNTTLLPKCSEKVSAVRNAEGNFYWVVTHYRNRFYSYRVDGSGVSNAPIVSAVGPNIDKFANIRGSIKISPDGTKLAIAHTIVDPEFSGSFYLYDFDAMTGVVSGGQLISNKRLYYGVEFSSNSSKLYASGMEIVPFENEKIVGKAEIVQFDLDAPDIAASEYLVHRFEDDINSFVAGALQIAIDKKIYHAIPNSGLSVIRTPNLLGLDSDFREFTVGLGLARATYGLPPFVQSFFETIVTIENFCEGDITTFTTESNGNIANIHWNFGDIGSGAANFSNDLNPTHVFSTYGVFTVTITVEYDNGSSRTFLEFVEIAEVPDVVQSVSLIQCDIDGTDDGLTSFNLNEAVSLFNNGNEDITALFFADYYNALVNQNNLDPVGYNNLSNGQIIYARAFENSECFDIVEVELLAEPMANIGYYDEVEICDANVGLIAAVADMTQVYEFLIHDFNDWETVSLYETENDALLEVNQLELADKTFGPLDAYQVYFRIENDNACALIGFVTLNIQATPEFEENIRVIACQGTATLTAPEGFDTYIWPDGSSQKEFTIDIIGDYDLLFGNGTCTYVQTFQVVDETLFTLENIAINDFNRTNSVAVNVGNLEEDVVLNYSIDGGLTFQESNTFRNLFPGVYDVVVTDGCNNLSETILVGGLNSFFTPNEDNSNDRWALANPEFFPGAELSIYDRYGKLLKVMRGDDSGWDGTFRDRQMPSDNYWYQLRLGNGRIVKGFFALKR